MHASTGKQPGGVFKNFKNLQKMAYTFDKLTTTAECDRLLDRANQEKSELEHEATGYQLDTTATERTTAQAQSDLTSVNAQITAFTAALAALPDGPEKDAMASKIRRLNDRKDNLEERLAKSGSAGLLLMQLRKGIAEAQLAELNTFITGVTARKAALG
jgi:predicted  nucleic acid-binding Zn-ribbon protein